MTDPLQRPDEAPSSHERHASSASLELAIDDPQATDVSALLARHLAFSHAQTPPESSFALTAAKLVDPTITFVSARREGILLGVGALKRHEATHAELKSMHTAPEARGRGVGRAVLDFLLDLARDTEVVRVSLETGTGPAFAPARRLYSSAGFTPCAPFADYAESPWNTFMTMTLQT